MSVVEGRMQKVGLAQFFQAWCFLLRLGIRGILLINIIQIQCWASSISTMFSLGFSAAPFELYCLPSLSMPYFLQSLYVYHSLATSLWRILLFSLARSLCLQKRNWLLGQSSTLPPSSTSVILSVLSVSRTICLRMIDSADQMLDSPSLLYLFYYFYVQLSAFITLEVLSYRRFSCFRRRLRIRFALSTVIGCPFLIYFSCVYVRRWVMHPQSFIIRFRRD